MIPKRVVTAFVAAIQMGLASAQDLDAPLLIPPAPTATAEDVKAAQADPGVAAPHNQDGVPSNQHDGAVVGGEGPLLVPSAPSAAFPESATRNRGTPDRSSRASSANARRIPAERPQPAHGDKQAEDPLPELETDTPGRSADDTELLPERELSEEDRQPAHRRGIRRNSPPRPSPVTDHSSPRSRDDTTSITDVDEETRARYRLVAGEWWFQLRSGRWKYFRGGEWRTFDPATFEPLRVKYTSPDGERSSDEGDIRDSPGGSGQQQHIVLRPVYPPAHRLEHPRWHLRQNPWPDGPPPYSGPPGPFGPPSDLYYGPGPYELDEPDEDERFEDERFEDERFDEERFDEERRRPVRSFLRGLFGRD